VRGRDAHCWPPAQIPACPIQAPGSYLIGGKAILFHKDELGDASGLSQQVREVVGNRAGKVVGMVYSAVDDHLSGSDQVQEITEPEDAGSAR